MGEGLHGGETNPINLNDRRWRVFPLSIERDTAPLEHFRDSLNQLSFSGCHAEARCDSLSTNDVGRDHGAGLVAGSSRTPDRRCRSGQFGTSRGASPSAKRVDGGQVGASALPRRTGSHASADWRAPGSRRHPCQQGLPSYLSLAEPHPLKKRPRTPQSRTGST